VGNLFCLEAKSGEVLWAKHFPSDFKAKLPTWGSAAAPVVYGNLLIAVTGGRPGSKVIAMDKHTGETRWQALSSEDSETGYSQPILHGDLVLIWHAGALSVLDAASGAVRWEHPFRIHMATPIATPVIAGPYVLVSAFFQGTRLLRMASGELIWRGLSEQENNTDTLNALMGAPIVIGDYVYGVCNYGQLRCLRLDNGKRVWESQQAVVERARNASAFIVRQGDRVWINNDRGELIIAGLSPEGYHEYGRTQLIEPTSPPGARREKKATNWVHPAYANRHLITRNDALLVRVSLER